MRKISKLLLAASFSTVSILPNAIAQTVIPTEGNVVEIKEESSSNQVQEKDEVTSVEAYIPTADAAQVQQRLMNLQSRIPLVYNDNVHSFVDYFIWKKPSFTKTMLERKNYYFPVFEQYLAKYNMPDELKYLAMIESGLNPKAVSRARAVGLWQFMKVTGAEHGLAINEYIDERMNIEKSTDAACRYLSQLYRIFGDWELALASYNSGPGTVRRAIRKAGNVTDYWQLHPYLPRDTRSYVPQFIAIMYMMNYASEYNIFAENIEYPTPTQSIWVDGYVNLETLASLSNIDLDELKKLNPHILKGIIPGHLRSFELKLPLDKYENFASNRQMILDSASKNPIFQPVIIASNSQSSSDSQYNQVEDVIIIGNKPSVSKTIVVDRVEDDTKRVRKATKKVYVVKRGDVLNRIAERYDVDMYDIRRWNDMRSAKILAGQRLVIYTDNDEVAEASKTYQEARRNNSTSKYHVVQPGDTLWSIAQRYGGGSIETIKRLNGMKSNTLKAGQKIKVVGS